MIVSEPPFDLVALVSDSDLQRLIEGLIERGQQRGCIREIRWYPIRDASRDALCKRPDGVLRPFFVEERRFLVAWDHEGSGREATPPEEVEEEVMSILARSGIPRDRTLAVAQRPELEIVFVPVWNRVKQVLAQKRSLLAPGDNAVLGQMRAVGVPEPVPDIEDALRRYPKETFLALLRVLHLRHSAALYRDLGTALSLPRIKVVGSTAERVASALVEWFPA